jgi:thiol-disulfide isomerase/thioredoxin
MLNPSYLLAILLIVLFIKLYIESSGLTVKEWFISTINNKNNNTTIHPKTQFDNQSIEIEKAIEDIKGKINKAVEEGYIEAFQQQVQQEQTDEHDQRYNSLDDTLMKTKTTKLLLFYSKSCPYCSDFLPLWYRIVNDLPNNTIYKEIEINENSSMAGKYSITEVPSIILLLDNEKHPFVGHRTYENISRFLRNQGVNLVSRSSESFDSSGYDNTPEPTKSMNANCPAVTFDMNADILNDKYLYQIFNEKGQYGYAEGGNKYDKVLSPFAAAYSVVDSYLSSLPDKNDPLKNSYENVNECANLYSNEIRQFGLCNANELNKIMEYQKKIKIGQGKPRFPDTDYSTNEKIVNAIKSACQFS